ncbi:hypothetical protein C1H46_032647 [Malus baccata]|uniref:Uncharacterized protein n=1 Tax=Malus baccata TaxID=106549 RepID=A0A540L5N6_MALBA|nr:hypothetical protein C1H46_032647 [Malus baccata]
MGSPHISTNLSYTQEPKGYIINRYVECYCGCQCDCSEFRINRRKRELGRDVYCGSSGAKATFDVMSEKYRGVEKNRPRTGECNIENLTSSLEFDDGVEYLLFVMVVSFSEKKDVVLHFGYL